MNLRLRLLLCALVVCAVLIVGQLYVAIALMADLEARFAVTATSAALTGSAFGIGYAAGFLALGTLSDRYGRRPVLVTGVMATAVATAAVAAAPSFPLLIAARLIQGFISASFAPAALALVTEALPPPRRAFGITAMSFAFLSSAPLAQSLAAAMHGQLAATMWVLAPLYGLAALTLAALAPAPHARAADSTAKTTSALWRNRALVLTWAVSAMPLFGFVAFQATVQALATERGIDVAAVRLAGLPPLLLTFAATPLLLRFGAPATARLGFLTMAGGFALAAAGGTAVVAAGSVLAAGVALALPGVIAAVAMNAGDANRGLALAIYGFILFIGASAGAPVAMLLSTLGGATPWFAPAMGFAGAAVLISAARRTAPADV
jgi:MFS transporter, YNFM family, putative membrane transport protein